MRTPGTKNGEPLAYFEAHFEDGGDECYPWPFHANGNGYAPVGLGNGKRCLVHVLACERAHGPCPPGMQVCHSCEDNPTCWNPRHLRWDTPAANTADRERTRRARGLRGYRAKLTVAQVEEIRARYYAGGVSQAALGAEFGVSQNAVSKLVKV